MKRLREKRRSGDRRDAERRTRQRPAAGADPDRRLQIHDAAELIGFAVDCSSGALGHIESFRFEEDSWGVTDIVVFAGPRARGRRRLLLPLNAVERVDRRRRRIYVRAVNP